MTESADSAVVPFLSIVIPTLNESATIEQTLTRLQSLRALQLRVELIVVDGGSEDPTVAAVNRLADIVIASPVGRARQMNAGAAKASGQWLLFLHADTQLPDTMDQFLSALTCTKADWGFFALRLSGRHLLLRIIEHAISFRSRLTSMATGDQCLFIREKTFRQCGRFPDIALMEDLAMSKTLRRQCRHLFWRDPVVTSSRRWEHNGIIRTILLMWILRLAYFMGMSPRSLGKIYYGR